MPVSRSRPVLRRAFERRAALGVGDEEASPRWAGCSGRSRWTIWAASGRRRRARAPNRTLTVHILTGNAPAAGRCQARRLWRVGSSPAGIYSSTTYDRRGRRSTSGSCRNKSGETTRLKCAKSAPSAVGVWSYLRARRRAGGNPPHSTRWWQRYRRRRVRAASASCTGLSLYIYKRGGEGVKVFR